MKQGGGGSRLAPPPPESAKARPVVTMSDVSKNTRERLRFNINAPMNESQHCQ